MVIEYQGTYIHGEPITELFMDLVLHVRCVVFCRGRCRVVYMSAESICLDGHRAVIRPQYAGGLSTGHQRSFGSTHWQIIAGWTLSESDWTVSLSGATEY